MQTGVRECLHAALGGDRSEPLPVRMRCWSAARVVALLCAGVAAAGGAERLPSTAVPEDRYLGPCALAVADDARTLYVACHDARQVAWIGLPDGRVIRRVDVPAPPTGIALSPDGRRLIVTCAAPKSTVLVLDAATGRRVAAIAAGHTAMSPALCPAGRRLYVCNRFDNDVSVIDLAAGTEIVRVPVVREPIAAAVTPDGSAVLVANHLPHTRTDRPQEGNVTPVVTLIDAKTHATHAIALTHGAHSLRGLCVLPDGKHALATHLLGNFEQVPFRVATGWINVNVLSVIDIPHRKVLSTIGLDRNALGAGNPCDVICTPDGKTVCVSVAGAHELAVIATDELLGEFAHRTMQPMTGVWPIYLSLGNSLWRRMPLPGKGPRGLAAAGSQVFVAEYFSDTVARVDPKDAVHAEYRPYYYGSPYSSAPKGAADADDAAKTSAVSTALGPPVKLSARRRGELLFNDATICYQEWQSCASCHPDGRADGLNWDLINDGYGNPKNTKSMLLAHRTPPAMAEGVRASAEVAVRAGLVHILFNERPEDEAAAIDAYLRSLEPVPSPRLVDGRLSASAEWGRALFESSRVGCRRCHPAPLYTDLRKHNVGTRGATEYGERFDTPTLVEVWRTAPYLHDGRHTTLRELFTEGRHGLRNVELNRRELEYLVEFVSSL